MSQYVKEQCNNIIDKVYELINITRNDNKNIPELHYETNNKILEIKGYLKDISDRMSLSDSNDIDTISKLIYKIENNIDLQESDVNLLRVIIRSNLANIVTSCSIRQLFHYLVEYDIDLSKYVHGMKSMKQNRGSVNVNRKYSR